MEWLVSSFEQLTLQQLYDVLRLRSEVFVVEQDCVYQDIDNLDTQCIHVMAYAGKSLEAYGRIIPPNIERPEVVLGRIVTSQNVRGKGYGKDLMKRMMEYSQKNYGGIDVFLMGQTYLERFYQEFGFKTISDSFLEDGIPHVNMVRKA